MENAQTDTATAEAQVKITHAVGLHARPSVKFTKLAKTFEARAEISASPDGPWIDAKSIVKVMSMKAPEGSTLHIRATGPDADQAVSALSALVQRDFDEAVGDGS